MGLELGQYWRVRVLGIILQQIVAAKHQEVSAARARKPLADVRADAQSRVLTRDFLGAMRTKIAAGHPAVIAEIKKASPSQGVIARCWNCSHRSFLASTKSRVWWVWLLR
ncbi:MAG: hypothetical protein EB064_02065 [Betaproteobacteria bacterium]|nr:hypothetical protein [Betaproteobacteria bacterium]